MDWQKTIMWTEKILPVALITGLLIDWFRLRLARRAEEQKHIARAISELLELRYIIRTLPEMPKYFEELWPAELKPHMPPNLFQSFDVMQLLPMDDKLPERYKKAVDEIAGFKPFLAFQLRGKERYFDFRNFITQHFGQAPGSIIIANKITEALDRDCLPVIEEALALLAKAHGVKMQISVKFALRRRKSGADIIPFESKRVFQEQILQLVKTLEPQLLKKTNPEQTTPFNLVAS
jgi:hypothetical protein